jgi:hypothetical protein
MIGVSVGVNHSVDTAYLMTQTLMAKIRAGID